MTRDGSATPAWSKKTIVIPVAFAEKILKFVPSEVTVGPRG
jgi:hypothetical protein